MRNINELRNRMEELKEDIEVIKHQNNAEQYGEVADRCLESQNREQTMKEFIEEFGEDNPILNWAMVFLPPALGEDEE